MHPSQSPHLLLPKNLIGFTGVGKSSWQIRLRRSGSALRATSSLSTTYAPKTPLPPRFAQPRGWGRYACRMWRGCQGVRTGGEHMGDNCSAMLALGAHTPADRRQHNSAWQKQTTQNASHNTKMAHRVHNNPQPVKLCEAIKECIAENRKAHCRRQSNSAQKTSTDSRFA